MNDLWGGASVIRFFTGLGLGLTGLIALSAWRYFTAHRGLFYLLLAGFAVSSTGAIATTNWVWFIVYWELASLTTALMLLWGEKKVAFQYFLVQLLGSNILFYAVLLALRLGYDGLSPINETWLQNLFIAGLGMKCALLGLHFWLPPVHTRAPAPVSALLSGWVVNLGFIVFLRLLPEGNQLLWWVGVAMIFYGGIGALLATDYKALLAYSSISQLGYIALGIGSGTFMGSLGAVFQMAAHGLAKTTLFIGSGYWEKECRGRIIYRFEAAFSRQRVNAVATVAGFCSLMGIPLFAGYFSKFLVKSGTVDSPLMTIILYGGTLVTVLYAMRFIWWGVLKDLVFVRSRSPGNRIQCRYPLHVVDVFPLVVGIAGLFGMGFWPGGLFFLMGLEEAVRVTFLAKEVWTGVLLLLAGFLVVGAFQGFVVRAKPIPSLDPYLDPVLRSLKTLSVSTFQGLFRSFQSQLAWIPVMVLALLIWVTLFSRP